MSTQVKISGVIITFNEARNIEDCIVSLKPVVDEILVVDSFSSDETVQICNQLGARVVQNEFQGHIEQKNFAIENAENDVILSLDADERLSEDMSKSVLLVKNEWKNSAYSFNRLNNYCGKWLRHSWYPDRKLRLWDRRKGKWGGTNPHDKVVMTDSQPIKLKGDILHYAYENLEEHFEQVKKFAIIAANSKYKEGKKANILVHIILNPFFKFVKRYFFRLGFLDGYYGLVFSGLTSYLNFMKYTRLRELNQSNK